VNSLLCKDAKELSFFILPRSRVTLYPANNPVPVVSTLLDTCTSFYTIDVRPAHPTEPNPDDRGIKRPQKIHHSRWRFSLSLSLSLSVRGDIKAIQGGRGVSKLTPFRLCCIQLGCGGAAPNKNAYIRECPFIIRHVHLDLFILRRAARSAVPKKRASRGFRLLISMEMKRFRRSHGDQKIAGSFQPAQYTILLRYCINVSA
jgi:hypothetical protein